jgi:hypothetical protein
MNKESDKRWDDNEEAIERFESMESELKDLIAFKRKVKQAFAWVGTVIGAPLVILIWEFITDI